MLCEGSGAIKIRSIKSVLCCCGKRVETENGKVKEHERNGPIVNGEG